MKELTRKVSLTIFLILSLFMVSSIIIYNYQSYKREYDDIVRSLNFRDRREAFPRFGFEDRNFDNVMIMDYEVYTVKLYNGEIDTIIYQGNASSDFDVEKIAKSILSKDKDIVVGNLYNNGYSYNYNDNSIVIINTKTINNRLSFTLFISILVLILIELMIYYVSRVLTKIITKPAQEALDKQKEFIADASHELKTPLAVIMASSDELKSDKKNEKYVDNIKYESERMSTLIKSLLDLSKLEKGIGIDNYKEENISKIIERISLTFEAIAFEQNVKIDTNIENDILFKCSKVEFERLISIILDNAIKHSYKKSIINVNVNKDKNNINIEIINKGDPIQPGDEEKIFERFYRADKSRNRDANRYGLGLAIAKNIVANHNGTIKAYSKDGKTTFKINLKK